MAVNEPEQTDRLGSEHSLSDSDIHVALTHHPLDATAVLNRVKSPKAGAVVLFAGCTRDSFAAKPVSHLSYSAYTPLALRSMHAIARSVRHAHGLVRVAIVHRLGRVDVGGESVLIAVAAPHRMAAWRAGEECLERVKDRVEIWKEEWFEDGGVWRSNRDGQAGAPVKSPGMDVEVAH